MSIAKCFRENQWLWILVAVITFTLAFAIGTIGEATPEWLRPIFDVLGAIIGFIGLGVAAYIALSYGHLEKRNRSWIGGVMFPSSLVLFSVKYFMSTDMLGGVVWLCSMGVLAISFYMAR